MKKIKTKRKTSARVSAGDFLLDIHTEPLPARFVNPALEQLEHGTREWLKGKINHGDVIVYGTLRHLVLLVKSVALKGHDRSESFKGPKESVWRASDGSFTPAAQGFARRYGLAPEELKPVDGVLYAQVETKGVAAGTLLAEMIVDIVTKLQFPKFMTWESSGFKFGRPIRSITALYGNKVVPVTLAGIQSQALIFGHPTYRRAPMRLKGPAAYLQAMRGARVLVDPAERLKSLLEQLATVSKSIKAKPDLDQALVDETLNMAEHPTAILGSLREEHMRLPEGLLKMVMKKQLKFFPVIDSSSKLMPYFIGVRDGLSKGNNLVREGYQRVLEARFNDADFFFGRDIAVRLESRLPTLERVTYQKMLGTMAQKAARVHQLCLWLAEHLRQTAPLDEAVISVAAPLVYADLVSDVVKEFPELQGYMGGQFARREGLGEKVALCLEQFYFPAAANAPIPATTEAAIVSLAGKLDTLAGCFAADMVPTGSADPYALRRNALGVVRIVLEKQLPLDLEAAVRHALSLQPVAVADPIKTGAVLLDFIWSRAATLFEEMGYKIDEIRAIRQSGLRDLPATFRRLAALRAIRREPAFEPLTSAFKRAMNILKQSKGIEEGVLPDRALLSNQAEIALYDQLVLVEGSANDRLVRGDFEGALRSLVAIKPYLDLFFDNVMVMDEDEGLKKQRFAVLAKLVKAFKRVADLSEIQPAS